MTRTLTEKDEAADGMIAEARFHLRQARNYLRAAKCPQATNAVRRALKSADGAQRHASRRPQSGLTPQPMRLP